jgi:hypothetical protein
MMILVNGVAVERSQQVARLISTGLRALQQISQRYTLEPHVFVRVGIGADGMAPEISIDFHGLPHDMITPGVDIQLWLNGSEEFEGTLIYSAFNPVTEEIDHQVADLKDLAEAQPYFERAVRLLKLNPLPD